MVCSISCHQAACDKMYCLFPVTGNVTEQTSIWGKKGQYERRYFRVSKWSLIAYEQICLRNHLFIFAATTAVLCFCLREGCWEVAFPAEGSLPP